MLIWSPVYVHRLCIKQWRDLNKENETERLTAPRLIHKNLQLLPMQKHK